MDTCADLSDIELGDQIVVWAGRLAAGLARQLTLIAEFDRREAWAGPGLLSCAHWLAWRTGLRPGAAREQVRVARALTTLPEVQAAFAAGRLSYSQARAITRVAEPGDEARWVELARHSTAGQLERLVRGVRRGRRAEEDAADPELAAYRMRTKVSYDEDGTFVMTVRVPAQHGAVVTAALDQVAAQLDRERAAAGSAAPGSAVAAPRVDSDDEAVALTDAADLTGAPDRTESTELPGADRADPADPADADETATLSKPAQPCGVSAGTPRATLAEALLRMAQDSLAALPTAVARRGRAALNLQVDPLSGWARLADGELLPPTSLASIRGSLPGGAHPGSLRPLAAADLVRHDVGRSRRLPGAALRELVGVLDGERCRFPGCTRVRRLDAHHVRFWRDGGRTDAANLLLLCARHHTLVHRDGFVLVLHPDRRLTVRTAAGVPVLHHPGLPWGRADELDGTRAVTPATLPPDTVEPRMDLGYAVMVMMQQAA